MSNLSIIFTQSYKVACLKVGKNSIAAKLRIYIVSFFEFILAAGFDESEYRKVIPNPAYDNAAKLIGKYFLEVARKYNIQFDEIFPGSFAASQECQQGDIEIRQFQLQAFVSEKPLCLLLLNFPHLHKKFGFPLPPKLEVIEFYY